VGHREQALDQDQSMTYQQGECAYIRAEAEEGSQVGRVLVLNNPPASTPIMSAEMGLSATSNMRAESLPPSSVNPTPKSRAGQVITRHVISDHLT